MAYQHLPTQMVTIPFVGGLNTKGDRRAKSPPALDICTDVEFDDIGGLRTRYPFLDFGSDILGGGTIENPRRIVANGDELLLFTKDTLYSWNVPQSKWVDRGTHLAAKLDETTRFATGEEQTECDRAEYGAYVLLAWTANDGVYIGAFDKISGMTLLAPYQIASGSSRPRLVALSTHILLFYVDAGVGLTAVSIDPTAITSTSISEPTVVVVSTPTFDEYYDATLLIGTDSAVVAWRQSPSTSYGIATVTSALAVTSSTKARICDGPIAVSSHPLGTHVQVVRTNQAGFVVQGDYIAIAALADVHTGQSFGTCGDVFELAAAHRSVTDDGQYRCYAFWGGARDTDGIVSWETKSNWVDTANNDGTEATFLRRMDVGSRAFDHDGRVYLWMIHGTAAGAYGNGGQLQNASYLYRDDAFLVAKSAMGRGGGFLTAGHLPGVAQTSDGGYAYCGTERSVFGELASSNYSGKRPRDVIVTFDSNEARRCVRFGRSLYITGGEILQYDGWQIVEVGFHVWPWYFALGVSGAGNIVNGTYAAKVSYRSNNAQGEIDRSAAVRIETLEVTAGPDMLTVSSVIPLYVTHKPVVAAEVWRTQVNPTDDSPYYLSSTSNPSDITNPQRHLPNDTTASYLPTMNDDLADEDLDDFGTNPQDVTLPSLAPPAATIIYATDTRLFLAGIAGEPYSIWYSKRRSDGESAAFNGALVATVPSTSGPITGLGYLNETLVVFCESAVYAMPGDGYDNAGGGANYGPARSLSSSIGAESHESVALCPDGLLFKSAKGWCLLNRGWAVDDKLGLPVSYYNEEPALAVEVMPAQHQVRIITESRMLVWDHLVNQWGEWTITSGLSSCVWGGAHVYTDSDGVKSQSDTYAGVDYGFDIETTWIKINELQGRGIVRSFELLGEFREACALQFRIARNYESVDTVNWSYNQDKTWVVTPATTPGSPLQVKFAPSTKRPIQAFKVRITALAPDSGTPDGDTVRLTGITLGVALEDGLYSGLAAAQKQ
jgi:hypothetical protein